MQNYSAISESFDEFNKVIDDYLEISKPEFPALLDAFEGFKIIVNEIRDSAKVVGSTVYVSDKNFISYLIALRAVRTKKG